MSPSASNTPEVSVSPVDNELPLRMLRRLHLVPANGLGTVRRALFLGLATWLPIMAWAITAGRLTGAEAGEPLLQHYGVHVRCLLAIPLLVLAEATFDGTIRRIAAMLATSGAVGAEQKAGFDEANRSLVRLRDASVPWVLVLGAALAWTLVDHPTVQDDSMAWATSGDGAMGFGGTWFAYVVRPVFLALVMAWLWRMLLVAYWMFRIGRLGLSLVPSHPDRAGGIAFVEKLPGAFAMVTFALSAVIASRWAHEVVHHEVAIRSFMQPAAAFAILWTLLALLPLLSLAPALAVARARAIPAYAALVGAQGRLVHQRWILGKPIAEDGILDAPGIGPVADAAVLYESVKRMSPIPIGKGSIVQILLPMALPMIVVAALRIPLKDLLGKLVKALL
jgi:hypothetical protein